MGKGGNKIVLGTVKGLEWCICEAVDDAEEEYKCDGCIGACDVSIPRDSVCIAQINKSTAIGRTRAPTFG